MENKTLQTWAVSEAHLNEYGIISVLLGLPKHFDKDGENSKDIILLHLTQLQ